MRYLLFILISFQLSFCNNQNSGNINLDYNYTRNDTIIKEIPLGKTGVYFYFYHAIKDLTKTLNLGSIEQGFDSLEIRIWFPEKSTSTVLIISNQSKKWVSSLCRFTYKYDISKGIDTIIDIKKVRLKPRGGWQKFSTKLLGLGIISLPHYGDIAEYPKGGADGEGYTVEVATVNKYRMYSYYDPADNIKIEQASRFMQIIELIKEEFGIN